MPTTTVTQLHVCSRTHALSTARCRMAEGQIRLASGGGVPTTFGALLREIIPGLTRGLAGPVPSPAVVVACPPSHAFDAYRVYTGDLVGVRITGSDARLVFADGTEVHVEDVLAVTL
ncbi:MAG TPA: hypothetical protein VF062_22405 [Candidatus Limnocylindrales bacterium]